MPTPPVRSPRHAAHRTLLLCVLSLALWCSQSLGLVHGVLHGLGHAAQAQDDDRQEEGLFGNHHSLADCHAFDALSHGDALPAAPLPLPCAASEALPDEQPPSGRIAPQASGFLARGPPSFFLS